MNKQYKNAKSRGIEWTDYTWNPIAGCFHACAWIMPDGKIANCYAEDVANKFGTSAYKHGFEHHYWKPDLFKQPAQVKTPSRIFVGSMADVFGHWVPQEQIEQVLSVVEANPQHQFQFLTKNPKRLKQFKFPDNAWVGISAPPTHMWGKQLNSFQQQTWLQASLAALDNCDASIKWMSIEPLSFDMAWILEREQAELQWAVIGAASNGAKIYQPDPVWVENMIIQLQSTNTPIFFKGNLKGNAAAKVWYEDFPTTKPVMPPVQQVMF